MKDTHTNKTITLLRDIQGKIDSLEGTVTDINNLFGEFLESLTETLTNLSDNKE